MRMCDKRRLLDLIRNIRTLHTCELFDRNYDSYVQCQKYAIEIGEMLERVLGDNKITHMLEEYCELIYVTNDKEIILKEDIAILDRVIDTVYDHIIEINTEYVVVFLPYKASMWDVFASIYEAVNSQSNSQAVVMPIPYYSFSDNYDKVHLNYEYQYYLDNNIPIVSFKEYNMEEEKPDFIFIHNPYDDCNKVTQVPQCFFSSNLVKYTDCLVYIPYYVSRIGDIADHFIVLPGVRNATKVIVQSEEIKKKYIRFYKEDKIVAIGSPKIDMIRQKLDKNNLPLEWKNKTCGKKVALVNINLISIMNHSVDFISKINYIIDSISKNKDWVVLWRPHPLTIETISSLRPELYTEYVQIEEKYKLVSNIILDKSSDIDRAVLLSDVYIGDESSVITLFECTGRPIYFTDQYFNCEIDINSKDDLMDFMPEASADTENITWYIYKNNLFRYMHSDKKLVLEACIDGDEWKQKGKRRLFLFESKIFCIMQESNDIAIYDNSKKELYMIKYTGNKKMVTAEMASVYQYKNLLYIVSRNAKNPLACICMETDDITYISIYNQLVKDINEKTLLNNSFNLYGCISDHYLWIPLRNTCFIVKINLDCINELQVIKLLSDFNVRTISKYGELLLCTEMENNRLIIVNANDNKYTYYDLKTKINKVLGAVCVQNNNMLLLQDKGGVIWRTDIDSLDSLCISYSDKASCVLGYEIIDEHTIRLETTSGIWILDLSNSSVYKLSIQIERKDMKEMLLCCSKEYIYNEIACKKGMSIQSFLDNHEIMPGTWNKENMNEGNIGKKIWEYLCNQGRCSNYGR